MLFSGHFPTVSHLDRPSSCESRMPRWIPCLSIALCLLPVSLFAQALVAPTEPLTPTEQQKKFRLPRGFEIQLVACEPDVNKPMNMKFDASGRLWVTHSREYPFPAKDDAKARDAITIFSQFQADGRADKVQRFAEHLNIPIGLLPLGDREALAWSIPNIFRFVDKDGDGVAEDRSIALGAFGFTDTHGNQNSFTRWVDGWVYACHGFNNHSQPKLGGKGEPVIDMQSGNTYRFRTDGSGIEQFSWGQVNPFGLAFDPLGNPFTADCHSRPVTMILREGYYDSFGKPHDGLGYAPETTNIDHGGTGIAGMVYYAATQFPAEFRDVLFVGNVITNRVHLDRLKWNGSSPKVETVEDFLVCDDPWFRPVDLQLGPDGALYVADFYNRIIGHYEVPLTHPGRDRERGRIWRVVYTGSNKQPLSVAPNLLTASADQLIQLIGSTNLTVRTAATNVLLDRFPRESARLALSALDGRDKPANTESFDSIAQRAHALWVVMRTDGIDEQTAQSLIQDEARVVRVHAIQALGETAVWQTWHFELVRSKLSDPDAFVRRAAVSALAKHPAAENIPALLAVLRKSPTQQPGTSAIQAGTPADQLDEQLLHAARIALRDQLRSPLVADGLAKLQLSTNQRKELIGLAALAPTGAAALLIYDEALQGNVPGDLLTKALPSVARYIDAGRIDALIDFLAKRYGDDREFQIAVLRGMHDAVLQRGERPSTRMRESLTRLVGSMIDSKDAPGWANSPHPAFPESASPWIPQTRQYADNRNNIPTISSLPVGGERLTGILRSPEFTIPQKLAFWMCGHNGPPNDADAHKNYVRLVLTDGAEVTRSYPPRTDVAQLQKWDLSEHAGKRGRVEVVDGFAGDAFAWLAVSRFDPPVISIPDRPVGDPNGAKAAMIKLAGELRLDPLTERITKIADAPATDNLLRLAAAEALISMAPQRSIGPLVSVLHESAQPTVLRQKAAELLGRVNRDDARRALIAELPAAPQPVAVAIASSAAAQKGTAIELLEIIRIGKASAMLLREPTVVERLKTCGVDKIQEQIAELTAKLAPDDDRIAKLIEQRRTGYASGKFDTEAGKAVFARTVCKSCHKVSDVGSSIGPALDGIGNRGVDRLLEDILDPNRNVDQAFRVLSVRTDSGQVISGFSAREEGKTLVLHDSNGQPVKIATDEIEERAVSNLSPMPANISEQISEQEFYQLLSYLLSQRAK